MSERKKADRLAKRLRTQLDTATDETDKKRIAADLRTAEIDGVYARFFPHRERYISLYPVAGSGAEGEEEKGKEGKAAEATTRLSRHSRSIGHLYGTILSGLRGKVCRH